MQVTHQGTEVLGGFGARARGNQHVLDGAAFHIAEQTAVEVAEVATQAADGVELAVEGAFEGLGIAFHAATDGFPVVGVADGDVGVEGDSLVLIEVAVLVDVVG